MPHFVSGIIGIRTLRITSGSVVSKTSASETLDTNGRGQRSRLSSDHYESSWTGSDM